MADPLVARLVAELTARAITARAVLADPSSHPADRYWAREVLTQLASNFQKGGASNMAREPRT
jgi:hypothetical protein